MGWFADLASDQHMSDGEPDDVEKTREMPVSRKGASVTSKGGEARQGEARRVSRGLCDGWVV